MKNMQVKLFFSPESHEVLQLKDFRFYYVNKWRREIKIDQRIFIMSFVHKILYTGILKYFYELIEN